MSNEQTEMSDPSKGQFVIICQAKESELEPARTNKAFLTARQKGRLV